MTEDKKPTFADVANKAGLKVWKVREVLGNHGSKNLHRVTDDEMAIILHAAADLGYENPGRGASAGVKLKSVTLRDVAKRAGVSVSVACSTFRKTGHGTAVAEDTRAHIKRIAAELGYKPTRESQLKDFYNKRK